MCSKYIYVKYYTFTFFAVASQKKLIMFTFFIIKILKVLFYLANTTEEKYLKTRVYFIKFVLHK